MLLSAPRVERYSRIEHDNRLLLSKMSDIMQRRALETENVDAAQYSHSLNRHSRKMALERISAENQAREGGACLPQTRRLRCVC